jgi:hypothetical protein
MPKGTKKRSKRLGRIEIFKLGERYAFYAVTAAKERSTVAVETSILQFIKAIEQGNP